MKFTRLKIENWRQFRSVDVRFHDRLTVLTGTNGAGKTTLLNTLSRALGWQIHMLFADPKDIQLQETIKQNTDAELNFSTAPSGSIELDNNTIMDLRIADGSGTLQVFGSIRGADGVYITSHRPFFSYSQVNQIPTRIGDTRKLFEQYTQRFMKTFSPAPPQEVIKSDQNPAHRLKETLIAAATFGEGNSTVAGDSELKEIFDGFGDIMKHLLPDEIGFIRLLVRIPELYIVSKSGVFPLEATSGGMSAIIDLAWQIFLASRCFDSFTVLIDEPENHLHPALQMRLLNDLIFAFPKVQFIVATHSPLMITSVQDSLVYALRPNDDRTISSFELNLMDKSASANETLDRVLGVDGSAPQWASQKIDRIVQQFLPRLEEPGVLIALKLALEQEGLSGDFTRVIKNLSERQP